MRTCLATVLYALAIQATAAPADYPTKSVTIVVPAPPGGIIDASARLIGIQLSHALSQPFVVENKGGGSGNVAYAQVARSPAEGYTLLASYSGYHVGNPLLTPKLPWAEKDLEPVALIATATNVITVNPSLPVHTLTELIAYLKAHPGELSYASQGNGSVSHIGTEIFKQQTGTQMLHVPYRGSGQALQDVLANQVQVFITTPPSVIGHIKSGKLRALAVTSKQRYPELPDVPTAAEAGLKGYELETWVALFTPAGTPRPVIAKMSDLVRRAMEDPVTRTSAEASGFEARYEPPDAVLRRVASESARWAKAIKEANITAD
ncbi:Bug family tripartite tricarboxylate transporter substrate binding protein [Variovorax flavidus]